ncbi:MAG: hypothetical protein ACFFFH_04875 [Candidatus Thorarchaeota archaeon]
MMYNFEGYKEHATKTPFESAIIYRIHKTSKNDRREYKIYEFDDQEFMSANGGWRPLAIKMLFFWNNSRILLLIFAIIIIDIINPYGYLNSIASNALQWIIPFNTILIFVVMPIALIFIVLILTIIIQILDVTIFTVQDPNKSSIGIIRGNIPLFGRTNWKVKGTSKENHAFVKLPGFIVLERSKAMMFHIGRIETSFGKFQVTIPLKKFPTEKAIECFFPTKCVITDQNNNLCFSLTWSRHKLFSRSDMEYRIDSPCPISPFLTFSISICLIEKFLTKYEQI